MFYQVSFHIKLEENLKYY